MAATLKVRGPAVVRATTVAPNTCTSIGSVLARIGSINKRSTAEPARKREARRAGWTCTAA